MKCSVLVFGGFLAALPLLSADAYEMPDVTCCTYINGALNIIAGSNDFTSVTAGVSGENAKDYSRLAFKVQVKARGADDADYADVAGEIPSETAANISEQYGEGAFFIWHSAADSLAPGQWYTVRVQATAVAAEVTTEWREIGDVFAYSVPAGTQIRSGSAGSLFQGIDDGSLATYFEHYTSTADAWAGRSFANMQKLVRVRFVPRSNWANRAKNAIFEVADDEAFTRNVRTVYTVPATVKADFTVYTIDFPEPVTCRAARVRVGPGQCCNFDEVEWSSDGSIAIDFTDDADSYPVVTWQTVEPTIATSQIEWACGTNGAWSALGEAKSGSGPFAVTNTAAPVGLPICYRVAKTYSDADGTSYSDVVRYVRPRRLDRSYEDETALLAGNAFLNGSQLTSGTETHGAIQGSSTVKNLFDGDLTTVGDVFFSDYSPCETALGLVLAEPAHIVAVTAHPRYGTPKRQSYMSIGAATSAVAYAAHDFVTLAAAKDTPSEVWYRYDSSDTATLFTHVFGYCNTSDYGSSWYGNTAEMRMFGWTESDTQKAGGSVAAPVAAIPESYSDLTPSVSWSLARAGFVTATRLEYAYQEEGPWMAVGADETGAGTFTRVLSDLPVGVPALVRVRYETADGDVCHTASTKIVRPRILERNGANATSVRTDVTILPLEAFGPIYPEPASLYQEGD